MMKQKIRFSYRLGDFLNLIKLSFKNPKLYGENIPLDKGFKNPLIFWLTVKVISSIFSGITKVIINQNPPLTFLLISQIVFSIPFMIISIFLVSALLYLLAKLLGGEGSYSQSFSAIAYSSLPFVFTWIPYLSILISLIPLYILVVSFKRVHHYSYSKAAINIFIPYLLAVICLFLLGLTNLLLNLDLLKSIPLTAAS